MARYENVLLSYPRSTACIWNELFKKILNDLPPWAAPAQRQHKEKEKIPVTKYIYNVYWVKNNDWDPILPD